MRTDLRLDLGGGTRNTVAPGHTNIDLTEDADIKWDLNKGLPIEKLALMLGPMPSNSDEFMAELRRRESSEFVEGIRCNQLVEHLDTIIPMMNDCYKVMKPGSLLEISTPKAFTDAWAQDPTHKKMFVLRTFDYFCDDPTTADAREEYGITAKFKVVWSLLEHGWNLQIKLQK